MTGSTASARAEELGRIRGELRDRLASPPGARTTLTGPLLSLATYGDVVEVNLRADQQPLAAELLQHYGDRIQIGLAWKPYPPGRPLSDEEVRVQRLLAAPRSEPEFVDVPGLVALLELRSSTVAPGQNGDGRVVLVNTGSVPVEFESEQPLVGTVLDPDSGTVVGGFAGAIGGTGFGVRLRPGETTEMGMLFGTAAGWDQPGYVLPPGRYLVQTSIPINGFTGAARGSRMLVPPAELVVGPST